MMGWLRDFVPEILLPTFTWPHRVLGSVDLASSIPPAPRLFPASVRRVIGIFHNHLRSLSKRYCRWCGIPYNNQVAELPFGLVLKQSDGTRLEEVAATMMARSVGFPVPKVILYGDHPDKPHAPVSILMTRIPGKNLGYTGVYEDLTDDERESLFTELRCILQVMRNWKHPGGKNQICSVLGTAIRSIRIPHHLVGPCESESGFNDSLFSCNTYSNFKTEEEGAEMEKIAEKLQEIPHPIVFTHGDLKHHNVMIFNGHITLLNWESAGWYPDYWEFTTPMRLFMEDFWWYQLISRVGGEKYMAELECERALFSLSVNSWIGWS